MSIFGGTISSLEQGLDFSATKQKTIAQNIANVDTPNYKAKNVSFNEYLSDAKQSTIQHIEHKTSILNFKQNEYCRCVQLFQSTDIAIMAMV